MRLTARGWTVLYCVLAIALILFLVWADAALFSGNLQGQDGLEWWRTEKGTL